MMISAAELVQEMLKQLPPQLPAEIALWNADDIATYLRRSGNTVRNTILNRPDFPKPIRIEARGYPLYRANEVIDWAFKKQRK